MKSWHRSAPCCSRHSDAVGRFLREPFEVFAAAAPSTYLCGIAAGQRQERS
jgi:hypothetical protein